MQTTNTAPAAVDALLHRATTGMLSDIAWPNIRPTFDFWHGYARALRDLQRGAGQKLAEKDARLGGYALPCFLRAAAGVLDVDFYRLSRVEIEDRLAQAGIKVPFDALTRGDVEATHQLEDGAVATVNLNEEHAVARVDADDGAGLHGSPPAVVGMDIVADGMQVGDTFFPKPTDREAALLAALAAILLETADNPELTPYSSDSYLPEHLLTGAVEALKPYGWSA